MDEMVASITSNALDALKPYVKDHTDKVLRVYLEPNDKYTDGFIQAERDVPAFFSIGMARSDTPLTSIAIHVMLRPEHNAGQWVSYTLTIEQPENSPAVAKLQSWSEDGKEIDVPPENLSEIASHFIGACQTTTSPQPFPKETPGAK